MVVALPHHYHTVFQVAGKNWFVANVSTNVETANPEAEIQPGLNLLGPIKQKFLQVSNKGVFLLDIQKGGGGH